MDYNNGKVNFKPLKAASIITLVTAAFLGIFSLFNQNEVLCSMFGYQFKETPLALIIFWAFIAGAVYAGVIGTLYIIKLNAQISAMKKAIKEMSDQVEE